jgi:GR25 family glycosyltransferase involved in LPS biosynthesis
MIDKINFQKINFKYINLKNREDRKDRVDSRLKNKGVIAERFEAVTDFSNCGINFGPNYLDGTKGCFLSHYNMIKEYDSHKILGIFEDDVVLCSDFDERFKYIEDNFNLDWDMFFLSSFYHLNGDRNRHHKTGDYEFTGIKYIHRTYGSFCTHSYLVNPKSKEKIIKLMEENVHKSNALDHLYILIQHQLNVFAITPGMTTQSGGYSDITKDTLNHTGYFTKVLGRHCYAENLNEFNYDEYFKHNIAK